MGSSPMSSAIETEVRNHFRFFVFVGISMSTGCGLCMNFCVESAVVHYCIAYFTIKTMNLHIFCKFIDSILIIL